jgi:acetolactate synthase-1/2/3 large subunit
MSKVDGGFLFGKALKNEGVDKVFTLCGEHIMPLLWGCREAGIEVVDFRHEGPAINAADAYARVTGRPSVVIATAGPGVTNTLTGMTEAFFSSSPVVLVGGASALCDSDTGTLQDADTLAMMKTCSKWARKVVDGKRIPYYMSMAFRHAMDATPGPVYVEIPMDIIFSKDIEEDTIEYPENYRTTAAPLGDPELIEKAADMLISAKRPYMVIANQARFTAQCGEAIAELANYLKIPAFVETNVRGLFINESTYASSEADVVLVFCAHNNYLVTGLKPPFFRADVKTIQVNPDITWIGFNKGADIGIVGGAGPVAKQILEAVKRKTSERKDLTWVNRAAEVHKEFLKGWTEGFTDQSLPIHPGRCAAEVAKFLETDGKDWTLVTDGGDATQWIVRAVKVSRPFQVVCGSYAPLGVVGLGAGFVTGAWCATGRPILYYTGDGSFGFYAFEWYTYVKMGIPVVCVISNDTAWGMIETAESIIHDGEIAHNEIPHYCTNAHSGKYQSERRPPFFDKPVVDYHRITGGVNISLGKTIQSPSAIKSSQGIRMIKYHICPKQGQTTD